MTSLLLLEPQDTVLPTDWCRPLAIISDDGGRSDEYSFTNIYSGRPINNAKWVRVRDVFGPCWYGKTVQEIESRTEAQYECVRGDPPKNHQLQGVKPLVLEDS